jgi:hypothetical protein
LAVTQFEPAELAIDPTGWGVGDERGNPVASATQAPSRMPPSESIAGYQLSVAVSTSTASRTQASMALPRRT